MFQFVGPIDGASIVARFYPECERHGVVVAGPEAAREWLRREQRMRGSVELADRFAEAIAGDAVAGAAHAHDGDRDPG